MRARVERLVPPRHRPVAAELALRINHVLSSYVRNQLLIALVMGLLYALGFAALRVPLALTLGLLSGLLNFIPYLGTLTGLLLSLLFVALDGAGLWRMLGVLGVFTLVQSIEGYYLTPRSSGAGLTSIRSGCWPGWSWPAISSACSASSSPSRSWRRPRWCWTFSRSPTRSRNSTAAPPVNC